MRDERAAEALPRASRAAFMETDLAAWTIGARARTNTQPEIRADTDRAADWNLAVDLASRTRRAVGLTQTSAADVVAADQAEGAVGIARAAVRVRNRVCPDAAHAG